MKSKIGLTLTAILVMIGITGCFGNNTAKNAHSQANAIANNRVIYSPKNDVEGKNYNARLRIADDPSTLLWCTAFPTNPNAPLITVPIVGKLTSGNKRPFSTSIIDRSADQYSPEVPAPDGFYGTSGEYRYGFRPDGVYVDFYNLETYCTTEPTTFQREKTLIDLGSDAGLKAVDLAVQEALRTCQSQQTDKTRTQGCPAAQALLAAKGAK